MLSVLRSSAFLLATVTRDHNPLQFWVITVMKFLFGIWEIVYDLAWRLERETYLGVPLCTTY